MASGDGTNSNIKITFYTNANETAAKINNLSASTTKFKSGMGGLTKSLIGAGTALMIAHKAFAFITDEVKRGITEFKEFELRLAEVKTILGESSNQTARFGNAIATLSVKYAQSVNDLTKGLYDIVSAAFSAQDAMLLLNQATKASIAGLSEVRTSVDIFTSVLNAYGMSATQATKVSDILFQSVVRGKFQFKDLESALGYVAPIAANAGVKFKELMAALSSTTRHGLHLDMTARGLALVIQGIVNPTEKSRKAAEKYGIVMDDLSLRVSGLTGFFNELHDASMKFGQGIISEVVPNMRATRVAAVEAGEGLQGLKDDMDLLSEASGKTGQAVATIMDTLNFKLDQLEERRQKAERGWGDFWGNIQMAVVEFGVGLAEPFEKQKELISLAVQAGEYGAGDKASKMLQGAILAPEKAIVRMKKLLESAKSGLTDFDKMKIYVSTLEKAEKLSKTMGFYQERGWEKGSNYANMEVQLSALNTILSDTGEAYASFIGEIEEGFQDIKDSKILLSDLTNDMERLHEELKKPIEYGWGKFKDTIDGSLNYQRELLIEEQRHADLTHDINMGLKSSSYEYKTLGSSMREAINIVREYDASIEKNRENMQRYNIAIRQNNLEIMKMELRGMMRRRGLSRGEQRRIKLLQIENMKERISTEEKNKYTTLSEYNAYIEKKKMIDEELAMSAERTYQMKYDYDQQITDLGETIKSEGELLDIRGDQWAQVNADILTSTIETYAKLDQIARNPTLASALKAQGFDAAAFQASLRTTKTELFKSIGGNPDEAGMFLYSFLSNRFGGSPLGMFAQARLKRWQTGTYRVPHTGLAMLHEGEQVVPRGSNRRISGGASNIHVDPMHINVNVYDHTGVEQLVQKIELAIQSGLVSGISTGFS